MNLRCYVVVLFMSIGIDAFAQIGGRVLDKNDLSPLSNVFIKNINATEWTLTDDDGKFQLSIDNYPAELKFHLLGKVDVFITYKTSSKDQIILLVEEDLKMDEVIVTAKRKKQSTGSNLVLGKQAIELIQAQSVADVMQLIPGKSITESQLHERQILTLRSAVFNSRDRYNTTKGLGKPYNQYLINNSFGVGYIIDGVPINNNINLSGNRSTKLGIFNNLTDNNSVGMGLDLKNLSLGGIESIEVVQGISSARYGDHNTGLIKINRSHGYTPYRVYSTMRGGSFGVTITKGIKLPHQKGFVNTSLDYLISDADPRNSLSKFDRVSADISWIFKKSSVFENTLSFSYSQNVNADNSVSNSVSDRRKKVEMKRFRLSNSINRYFYNVFVSELSGLISLDFSANKTESSILKNNGGQPVLNSFEEKTYVADYTPVAFRATETIDNKPLSLFTRLEVIKTLKSEGVNGKISLGTSLGIDKNFGLGNYSASDKKLLSNVNESGSVGFRNVNFNKIIPADIKFSAYITTNIGYKIFSKKWMIDLGIRYDNYNDKSALEPRLNTSLHFNEKIKIHFGAGLFAKSPSLQALFPGKVYYDYLLRDFRTYKYAFALGHTFIRQYKNSNIKPSKTFKLETGLDYKSLLFNMSLTVYYNKQYDGFTNYRVYEKTELPDYHYTFYGNIQPDYTPSGSIPTILGYSRVTNDLNSTNFGVELLFMIDKIRYISTSFNINATYRYTRTFSGLPYYIRSKEFTSDVFMGLHRGLAKKYETINSSVTAIHHISSVGLIITLTAEQFIMAKNSIHGSLSYPYAYFDRELNLISIPETERSGDKYIHVRKSLNATKGSSTNIPKMYVNYHLKLAKQFDNGLKFSFYAVNFLNHLPKMKFLNSNGTTSINQLNRPISFGGSISYEF